MKTRTTKHPEKSIDILINEKIHQLECPNCHANSDRGDSFFIYVSNSRMILTLNNDYKNTKKWIVFKNSFVELEIDSVRCGLCLSEHKLNVFENQENDFSGFNAIVYKISKDWITMKSEDKVFFVLSRFLTRDIEENDSCIISGILLNEIENNSKIECNTIEIRKEN